MRPLRFAHLARQTTARLGGETGEPVAANRFSSKPQRSSAMSLIELLVLLLIAGICGSIAQALTGFHRGGCLLSVALGFIGALVGMWMARRLGLPEPFAVEIGGQAFPVVWSIVGAAVVAIIVGLLTPRRTV